MGLVGFITISGVVLFYIALCYGLRFIFSMNKKPSKKIHDNLINKKQLTIKKAKLLNDDLTKTFVDPYSF